MAEVVYTGGNYPVKVGGIVIDRVQSVNIARSRTLTDEYQMGTEESLGQSVGTWGHTVEITMNPINTQMERALIAETTATDPVTLTALAAAAAVDVITPTRTSEDCIFQSVRYSASVPDTTFSATWQLKGLNTTTGAAVAAPATTGVVSFKPKNIYVRVASLSSMGTTLLRVKSLNINVAVRNEDWFEFSNEDPWYVDSMAPTVTMSLTWHGSRDSVAPGTLAYDKRPVPEASAPDDFEIQLIPDGAAWDAAGNIKIEIANVIASDDGTGGSTDSSIDDTITYSASDPGGTGGFQISVIA